MVKHGGFSVAPHGNESISVIPDNASTSITDGTITQYDIIDDDLFSQGIQRNNKPMLHMAHLKYELTRFITTIQKHGNVKNNNYRHTQSKQAELCVENQSHYPAHRFVTNVHHKYEQTPLYLIDFG